MAANKRKQDEKHLKLLREMVALPHNKQCFDCNQRGPTYINMTIGSFVCTSCSGILRGLNPPHRVKSISMTSFSPEEMEFLKSRGNDFCRKVWLGLYDSRSYSDSDSKDENKRREFMAQKYERKRWYVAPTESMHEEARKQNTPPQKQDTKSIRSLGGDIPKLSVQSNQPTVPQPPQSKPANPPAVTSIPVSIAASTAAMVPPQSQQTGLPPPQKSATFDLISDLGGDPFGPPTVHPPQQSQSMNGGFANFDAFNQPQPPASQPAFPPASTGFLEPLGNTPSSSSGGGFPDFSSAQAQAPTQTSTANITGGESAGDRYAALADLDSVFGSSSGANVNWESSRFAGSGGRGRGQGWPGSTATSGASPASSAGAVFGSSSSTSTGAAATDWNQGDAGIAPAPSSSNPFLTTETAANPFGGAPVASQANPPIANPFMSQGGFGAPGAPGGFAQFGTQPSAAGGFGQFNAPTSSTAGGQFNMQNGGFVAQQQALPQQQQQQAAWGMNAFGAGGQGFGANMQFNKMVQQPGGFGMPQQQGFAAWPAQQPAMGNPFMGGAGAGQAIPPRSSSTNPFL